MTSHTKHLLTALLVVGLVALAGSPAAAQSEMTSKIRLECAVAPGTDCVSTAGQIDFSVVEGNLAVTKVGGGTKVGIGTTIPTTSLHAAGSDGTTKVFVEETSGAAAVRELFALRNNGGPFFVFTDTALNASWAFASLAFGDFQINQQQSTGIELRLTPAGNMTLKGTLTQGSSREIKTGIEAVDSSEILARVIDLPIAEWSYNEESNVRHLGPMAEDFSSAFGLGNSPKGIAPGDTSGVALAAIQGLHQELVRRDATIDELALQNQALLARLTALEEKVAGEDRD